MTYCRHCGTKSNGTSRFCRVCGAAAGGSSQTGAIAGQLAAPLVEGFLEWAGEAMRTKAKAKIGTLQNQMRHTWGGCPSAGPLPGTKEPGWYADARREQQPRMSAAEIAVRQDEARERARRAEELIRHALEAFKPTPWSTN